LSKERGKVGLIRKASQASLLASIVLMLVSTVVLFFYTNALLKEEVEEGLYSTEARIVAAIRAGDNPYSLPPLVDFKKVPELQDEVLKDTMILDPFEGEIEPFKELTTFRNIRGENYQITVRSLSWDSEDILIAIVFSYCFIILLAFAILFYVNKAKSEVLWNPFFENLKQMKNFSLTSETPIQLVDSDISEFSDLNAEIVTLTNRVRSDYRNLKQFTEDVSHEMQTPLAIMQAKIENIINEKAISEGQFEQLTSIQKDIRRLTRLNRKLTLLSKIDNRQFVNLERVSISDLVKESIENFSGLSDARIAFSQPDPIVVDMDRHLAEILCNNLISNAIKHNLENGNIQILSSEGSLTISNAGAQSLKDPTKVFHRFYRETKGQKSTGLGLSIAKKICDLYGFEITYHFRDNCHVFTLNFNNS